MLVGYTEFGPGKKTKMICNLSRCKAHAGWQEK